MDESETELISLLLTRIGMLMEDTADVALTAGAMEPAKRRAAIAELGKASESIAALIKAVQALQS